MGLCQTQAISPKFVCWEDPTKTCETLFWTFQILSWIDQVAYRLTLLDTSKIHLVFHCFVLKPYCGPPLPTTGTLPSNNYNYAPLLCPLVILGTRENTFSESPQLEVLVQCH